MKKIINFYQSLDTVNLIIFWGLIIVLILLFIVLIIVSGRNKRKKMAKVPTEELPNTLELPVKKIEDNPRLKEEIKEESTKPIEEKNFIAEEHIMEYNKDVFTVPGIKKATEENTPTTTLNSNIQTTPAVNKPQNQANLSINEPYIPNKPYQKNVLREMSLNQTSPIGIVKPVTKDVQKVIQAEDLHTSLNDIDKVESPKDFCDNNYIPHISNSQKESTIPVIEKKNDIKVAPKEIKPREDYNTKEYVNVAKEKKNPEANYLEEVSKKLSETIESEDIDRTEYELRQEEEAIISYEELMQKKDSLKMIDEEDAVISIDELMQKKKKEEKLYQLTEEEENDKFIDELKHFRSDL